MSDNIYHPRNLPLSAWLREEIMRLWEKNVSAVEIARKINPLLKERNEKPLTRNAVIGHVYRARVAGDIRAEARTLSKINAARSLDTISRPKLPPVDRKSVSLSPVRFMIDISKDNLTVDLAPLLVKEPYKAGKKTVLTIQAKECHFPTEDFDKDGRRIYCGAEAIDVIRPYCLHHRQIIYRRIVVEEDQMNALT